MVTGVLRSPWTARLQTVAVALLVVLGTMVAQPGQAYAGPNEADFFAAANAERASNSLPAYTYAGDLAYAARAQAERMAASGVLAHNPDLGGSVANWQEVAENVGVGPDWSSIHQALMNSASHRAAILDSGFTQMGVGTAVDKDGSLWVAEVFRLPAGATSSSGSSSEDSSAGSTSTPSATSSYTGTTAATPAAPTPSPSQILRGKIEAARDKVAPGSKAHQRGQRDPLTAALDYTTVMNTVG